MTWNCPSAESEEEQEDNCSLPLLFVADGATNEDFFSFINESELTTEQVEKILEVVLV